MSLFAALLLWMPPPLPPPPDRMAAAEEVLRLAPVPPDLDDRLRDSAIYSAAYGFAPGPDPLQTTVRKQIARHVASQPKFADDFSRCLTIAIARRYDGPTLKQIGEVVTTPGGQALLRRGGRLGVAAEWDERKENRLAFSCLLHGARLAGYDLPVFEANGTEVTVIGEVIPPGSYRSS